MKKNELINEIIRLYDENTELKNEMSTHALEGLNSFETLFSNISISETEHKLLIEGKKLVFEKVVKRYYNTVEVSKDEVGNLQYMDFEKWMDNVIYSKEIPSCLSLDEFVESFEKELMEMYESKKREALIEFEGKVNEDNK